MSRHEWSEDDTFELIRLYEANAPLWDAKHADYRNREVKTRIISNIAKRMNVTAEEINRKLHNLRNQVSQELNKLKRKRKYSNSDELPTSNWSYFKALKFLIPNVLSRTRTSDIIVQRMIEKRDSSQRNTRLGEVEDEETSERRREERREKRKRPNYSSDTTYEEEPRHSPRIPPKVPNEDDRFGEYVALELRSLRSEVSKRKLKSEIRRAICRIADLDDAGVFDPGTTSNPSPPYSPPPNPVPTYTPVCEITNVKSENI